MIRECVCKHKGQDTLHGEGRRVFNVAPNKDGSSTECCTVCNRKIERSKNTKKKDAAEAEVSAGAEKKGKAKGGKQKK